LAFTVFSCLIVGFGFSENPSSVALENSKVNPPIHFGQAKHLAKQIYIDHRMTFYCGCRYDKHNQVDLESCGYEIQKDKRRARRIEWEHIMPVSHWGKELPCWKNRICCKNRECYSGRRCCREVDEKFSEMEADLHNLVPAIGELNGLRSNYRFGILPHVKSKKFGACELKIDKVTRRIEPRAAIRGAIARAYLYMSDTYKIPLSDSQQQLMSAWNTQYPPDTWEIERDKRIAAVQGNHNLYIAQYAKKIHNKQSFPIMQNLQDLETMEGY
jgi:deoxyribonuclease-1